jgi:hypothetical protein
MLAIALLLWGFARQSAGPDLSEEDGPAPVVDPATLSIYTNGVFGFSILYPETAVVEDSFIEGSGFAWRTNTNASGTPIVRLTTAGGEVRIGASDLERAVETCLDEGPSESRGETAMFGTTTWSIFAFDELGTDDERRVTSYRALHEDRCFAVETFEPLLAAGAEAPTEDASFIVRNFTFAR